MSNLKIGVTGASGFVGSYLLNFLAKRGHRLHALARTLPSQSQPRYENVTWHRGDLCSLSDCTEFVQELDVLMHLAHTNSPLTSNKHLPSDGMLNIIPTLNLLQAIRESGKKLHLVYASSGGAIYKSSDSCVPFSESDLCEPISSYGIQKLVSEHYLRMSVEQGWLTATALRIANPYGVLLPAERTQGFIGVALNQILHNRPVKIYGNANNVRDYIHLEDVCRIFEMVVQPTSSFEVYNVGSGEGYSVNQVLELIEKTIGSSVLKEDYQVPGTTPNQMSSWNVLNITKARERLGWLPSIDLQQGLKMLCEDALGVR